MSSLRNLVDGDCGAVNPLMQLGGQFTRDAARKDEGLAQAFFERSVRPEDQMTHEFLGHVTAQPQSFQMQTLLEEMRDIELASSSMGMGGAHLQPMRNIGNENTTAKWTLEFAMQHQQQPFMPTQMVHMLPQQQQMTHVREFFDDTSESAAVDRGYTHLAMPRYAPPPPYRAICPPYHPDAAPITSEFFAEDAKIDEQMPTNKVEDWFDDYQRRNEEHEQTTANYNKTFWDRLQDEWQKMAEESDHPWLSDDTGVSEYAEYEFAEENPMSELDNVFEKGKEYMAKGDIPSAVLCFEAAAKADPNNAEVWEYLGLQQADNEMDPQAIAALRHALSLRTDNPHVLMALAVCYTNEGLQNSALQTLINWLHLNPRYAHLTKETTNPVEKAAAAVLSSVIPGNQLQKTQELFLNAVRLNPQEVDPEVQNALGVLYNLNFEYDKAVDCFQVALHVDPLNAKVWNRLGASLANGSRSVEAVEAYQRALELEPGFIRARYNVGICCMNLKAYKQAVEHLLTALNMQANAAALRDLPELAAKSVERSRAVMSESMWSTLKMIISLMGRGDLQGVVNERNLPALNEAFQV